MAKKRKYRSKYISKRQLYGKADLNIRQKMQIRIRRIQTLNIFSAVGVSAFLFVLFLLTAMYKPKETDVVFEDENAVLTMNFVGDVMLGRNIGTIGEASGYSSIFSGVSSYFVQSDYVFANLENAVLQSEESYYTQQDKNIHLYCSYSALDAARAAGINVFSCANNHAYDYGDKALTELISYFDRKHISYSGIGNNIDDAATYKLLRKNDVNIAFLSVTDVYYAEACADENTPGLLTTSHLAFSQIVNTASRNADLTVVYIHWGNENEISADEDQKNLGHQLIDAGADIVIGSHPHVIQDIELYKNGIIFYSLGNFIFDQGNTYSKDSVIVHASLNQDGSCSFKLMPVRISNGAPIVTGNEFYRTRISHKLLQNLNESDYQLDSDGDAVISLENVLEQSRITPLVIE